MERTGDEGTTAVRPHGCLVADGLPGSVSRLVDSVVVADVVVLRVVCHGVAQFAGLADERIDG